MLLNLIEVSRRATAIKFFNRILSFFVVLLAACLADRPSDMQGGKAAVGTPNQAWLSLDLLLLFSQLYDNGHAPAVHQILQLPRAQCPEVLVLATASALRHVFVLL